MKFCFYIALVLCIMNVYKSDIPVHCVKSQIQGEWDFVATPPQPQSIEELYKMTCGHKNPSHESNAYNFNMDLSLFTEKFSINLGEDFVATMDGKKESKVQEI